jgi:hypothetical protein
MMTKWDTIQADVSDAYIGLEENLAWEQAVSDDPYYFDDVDDDELTLDWNE